MASTVWLAPTANYVQSTLNGAINSSVGTITLNSTTNLTAPGYVVIDRTDSAGTATPSAREVVSFTGISGNDLTGCTRPADGSTARSHSNGAIVETMPTIGMWNSLATIVGSGFDGSGYLRPIASPASIAILQIKTMLGASGASVMLNIPEIYFPILTLSNAVPVTSGRFGFDNSNLELVIGDGTSAELLSVGAWRTYNPIVTGFAAASPASIVGRYARYGKTCIDTIHTRKVGVSNGTGFNVEAPVVSANNTSNFTAYGQGTDNGAYVGTAFASLNANSTTINCSTLGGAASWTASGEKGVSFTLVYETA